MASQSVRYHLSHLCYSDLREYFQRRGSNHPEFVSNEFTGVRDPLRPGSTSQEVASVLLLRNLFKKFEDETAEDAPDRCLLAFLESNYGCSLWTGPSKRRPPLSVRNGFIVPNPDYLGYENDAAFDGFDAIKACLRDTFCAPTPSILCEVPGFDGSDPWSWENIFLMGNNGPGASLDASGTSWLDKFYLSPITYADESLKEAYLHSLTNRGLRWLAENQRAAQYGFSKVNGGVFGSVPKSFDTERSIETQPALNMWAQKGIAAIMEQFVRSKYGVDLSVQPDINKELARRGSIDDSNVTIDLKEASNRIPLDLIKACLAGTSVLDRILVARVNNTMLPWGQRIDLHMCSTMGNGFTFILQTAVFLAVVEAAYAAHKMSMQRSPALDILTPSARIEKWVGTANGYDRTTHWDKTLVGSNLADARVDLTEVDLPDWGVFGDDIIVPKRVCDSLEFYLRIIGAKVNSEKSFKSGPFRESCGGDFFNGDNVRAVYCRTLRLPQDKLSLINRLNDWTSRWGIPLRRLCSALWGGIPEKLLVPLHEADDAGLRCPKSLAPRYPASKAALAMSKDIQVSCLPYRYFKVRPYTVTYSGAQLVIYGPGLLLGMLKGEISSSWASAIDPKARVSKLVYELRLLSRNPARNKRSYDVRWGLSSDWDRFLGNNTSVVALEWAIRANLPCIG